MRISTLVIPSVQVADIARRLAVMMVEARVEIW
jgi:hypothetical protein